MGERLGAAARSAGPLAALESGVERRRRRAICSRSHLDSSSVRSRPAAPARARARRSLPTRSPSTLSLLGRSTFTGKNKRSPGRGSRHGLLECRELDDAKESHDSLPGRLPSTSDPRSPRKSCQSEIPLGLEVGRGGVGRGSKSAPRGKSVDLRGPAPRAPAVSGQEHPTPSLAAPAKSSRESRP